MKRKMKGRKIYTYRARNRRVFSDYHPLRSAIGTVLTLILVVVIGFVGYNVVGPIVTRLQQEKLNPTATADPYFTENSAGEIITAVQTQATTTPQTTTSTDTTTETSATTTTEAFPSRFPSDIDVAYFAAEDALKDLDSVEAAAKKCRENGYRSMILPLKLSSGMLQYSSSVDKAAACGASNDEMLTLREIVNAAKRYDVSCIGQIFTLEDHTFPNFFMEGSYVFKEGTTRWLDNKPEEGGKPWLNPFDAASADYLAGIAAEIQKGGFTQIICTGTIFPHFFRSDAELIGNHIEDADKRKEALVSVLNRIADVAPTAGLYADLYAVSQGTEEAFQPAALHMTPIYMEIHSAKFTEAFTIEAQRFDPAALAFPEKIKMLAEAARIAAGSHEVIPILQTAQMSEAEIETAVSVLGENGFKKICLYNAADQA